MAGVRRTLAILATAAVLLAACGSDDPVAEGAATLAITTDDDVVELEVEVADDEDERSTGLMHREELAPFDGMAFVWDEPVSTSFWMKDTLIPLSIAFWGEDGRIVAILDMDPCEADPCPTYDPEASFVGAVEVRQGLFGLRRVEVGDLVELDREGR
jgi:uncharacterized membrane protein (UPF0127 family)